MLAKKKKNLLPSLRKPNAKCSWNDEMQGRHSTNFEHQVSLWFFFSSSCFFFYIFSDYFFPVCFLSLHNKSLRKAFQFKWMKKKANVLCMQPTAAAAAARADWLTHRERGRGGGREVREAEQTKCEWCAQVESKRLLATRFSRFTRTLEVIRKLIKQIKYCYEEKAIITHKGGEGWGGRGVRRCGQLEAPFGKNNLRHAWGAMAAPW